MDKNEAYNILLSATAQLQADRKTHELIVRALQALKPAEIVEEPKKS